MALLLETERRIRAKHRFYCQDLNNNLFSQPYTKIEMLMRDLKVSRITATSYLDLRATDGFLRRRQIGRSNYCVNESLFQILADEAAPVGRLIAITYE